MSTANWSELPSDVLGYLIGFLPLPDYHRFSAVCQNWCTVTREKYHRPAQQLPWLVLGEDIATKKRIFFNLSENKHYYMDLPELRGQFVCGSSFGWLFTVDITLNIRMLNPFTRKTYDLPDLDFSRYTEHVDDLIYKVILDHDPSERSDFTVMVVGSLLQEVAFWRHGDPTWTVPIYDYYGIDDIIFFKGNFYAVGCFDSNEFFLVDVDVDVGQDSKLIRLQHHAPILVETFKYLMDFKGELWFLQREIEVTTNIVFHKYDLEKKTYFECKHINNHAFFIGDNSTVVIIDPTQFSGCTQNTIYFSFSHDCFTGLYPKGRYELQTYNMVTKGWAKYYLFENFSPDHYVAPTWLTPNP